MKSPSLAESFTADLAFEWLFGRVNVSEVIFVIRERRLFAQDKKSAFAFEISEVTFAFDFMLSLTFARRWESIAKLLASGTVSSAWARASLRDRAAPRGLKLHKHFHNDFKMA